MPQITVLNHIPVSISRGQNPMDDFLLPAELKTCAPGLGLVVLYDIALSKILSCISALCKV
jgi:hypothetical protein